MTHAERPSRLTRFLTLAELAELADAMATSVAQVTALVHRGELRALELGGRGQWRVQRSDLESFSERAYAETVRHLERDELEQFEQAPEWHDHTDGDYLLH